MAGTPVLLGQAGDVRLVLQPVGGGLVADEGVFADDRNRVVIQFRSINIFREAGSAVKSEGVASDEQEFNAVGKQ